MNPRGTIFLAIAAALLGSFVYYYEIGGEADRKAADQAEMRVFTGLEAASIDAIELETQDGIQARFGLQEGIWELLAPGHGPADATAFEAMTSVLAGLTRQGRVESVRDLEEYGLAEDARIIRFEANGESLGLRIGRSTPVGGDRYVAPLGSEDVSYVETFRLNAFNRNLADLRDRRVLPFESEGATAISLIWPGAKVELVKQDGLWEMSSPVEERADSLVVRSLLENLSFLRAQGFIDQENEAVKAALADMALEIRLRQGGDSLSVVFGGPYDGGRIVRTDSGRLFTIAPERFEDFERDVTAYRFKTLSDFDLTKATRLGLRFASGDAEDEWIDAHLEGAGWTIDGMDVDADRISGIVRAMSLLRAVTVVADEMGRNELASLGLAPPRVRIRLTSGEGAVAPGGSESDFAPLAEVLIGRFEDEKGIYAQRAGDPKVYLLDVGLADSIPISRDAFVSRFLPIGADPEGTASAERDEPANGASPDGGSSVELDLIE